VKNLSAGVVVTVLALGLAQLSSTAAAHRSGCHRWHSCESDHGTYVCGDLGYTSECVSQTTSVPTVMAAPPVAGDSPRPRYTNTNVNLRAGPSAETAKLATLPTGALVMVQQCAFGWCQVTWQEKVGYLSQKRLRE
jgi:uncharacterized protein YgiM (DUF1202 family)